MTHRTTWAAVAAGIVCTACGTLCTRPIEPVFGGAPFAAVAWDVVALSKVFGPTHRLIDIDWSGPWLFAGGLLSLPIDLAVDVVALPVDLVAWACGHEKNVLQPQVLRQPDAPAVDRVVPGR